jgi:Protein of unknown function (DUF2798)
MTTGSPEPVFFRLQGLASDTLCCPAGILLPSVQVQARRHMIPKKYAPILFGLMLSGLMSLLVSGISTARAIGLPPGFVSTWLAAWLTAWAIAFPSVLVVAPITRRLVDRLTADA